MLRTIKVEVDQSTRPPQPGPPVIPNGFHTVVADLSVDILSMLLLIGHLTTPAAAEGISLSEFWAWVRYFFAIGPSAGLALTQQFAELDSHQKTILSDDFGMGLPMYWLTGTLGLGPSCDGEYFRKRHAASIGATVQKTSKRGSNKSPDFVCLDGTGLWHVIECKGTQRGPAYRDKQMSHTLPSGVASGAIVQKRTIVMPPAVQGQRLACGVTIAVEGDGKNTQLLVRDPEPGEKYAVREQDLAVADDPPLRATLARILRLSGFDVTASVVAAPSGRRADSAPQASRLKSRFEDERKQFVIERRRGAHEELSARRVQRQFQTKDHSYIGRQTVLDLPMPLEVDGKKLSRVSIRQGLNVSAIEAIGADTVGEEPIGEQAPWLRDQLGIIISEGDGVRAQLRVGTAYHSDIELISD